MQIPDIIIAIDGYSSTGKSSFAKLIAKESGFLYLDSGALYRGVTLFAMENGLIDSGNNIREDKLAAALKTLDIHFENIGGKTMTFMGDRCIENEIRTLGVSGKVSPIATLPVVREYVDKRIRDLGKGKRIVVDGRDIGSTVFPDAELKIYVTASARIRAQRRFDELQAKGEPGSFEEILANVEERDRIDMNRPVSPLRKADDAIVLDNSEMTIPQQKAWLLEQYQRVSGEKI